MYVCLTVILILQAKRTIKQFVKQLVVGVQKYTHTHTLKQKYVYVLRYEGHMHP